MDFQSLKISLFGQRSINPGLKQELLVAGSIFALLTIIVHGSNLSGFWRWDDGMHIAYAHSFSSLQYFFDPEVTRLQSGANVSPWNAFFYDINLELFGMNPVGHYGHMLLLLWLAGFLFYFILRSWLPPLSAFVGTSVLLLGKPTLHIAAGLMHGHYAAGLVFSFLALLGWIKHFEKGGRLWLPISVISYLLAVTCKEIYVPLVVILPFLPIASWRRKLWCWIPYVLISIFYIGWRYVVLGRFLGGYERNKFSYDEAIAQFLNIPYLLFGVAPGFLFFASFFLFLVIAVLRQRINWFLCLVVALTTLLPLIPLTSFPGVHQADRYLFGPWISFSALVAVVLPRSVRFGEAKTIPLCLLMCSILVFHWQGRKELESQTTYWDQLYHAALSLDTSRQALFVGEDDGYKRMVLGEARRISDSLANRQAAPKLVSIDKGAQFLHYAIANKMEILEFRDGQMRSMEQERIKSVFSSFFQDQNIDFAREKVLGAEMILRNGVIYWKFVPDNSDYYVSIKDLSVLEGLGEVIKVPHQGQASWRYRRIQISFCYVVEHSVRQYCSPMLNFDFEKNVNQSWTGLGKLKP